MAFLFAGILPISAGAGSLDQFADVPAFMRDDNEPPLEPPPIAIDDTLCDSCSPIYVLCKICDGNDLPVFSYYRVPQNLTPAQRANPKNFHWYNGHFYTIHLGNPRVWYMDWKDAPK